MRFSLRLWQTLLFITVIVVAMLTLSYSLISSTRSGVARADKAQLAKEVRNISMQIGRLMPYAEHRDEVDGRLAQFARVFGIDVWLVDSTGRKLFARGDSTLPDAPVAEIAGEAAANRRYVVRQEPGETEHMVAAQALVREGDVHAVVVVGDTGADAQAILDEAGRQITVAFWIALVVSGVLGWIFSEIIALQVRRLSDGALAIAQGNFDMRLKGMFPDEVGELATSFNVMAERLGTAFEALSEQQREIATVVETMAEGLIAVDYKLCIRLVNPAAAELLAKPVEGLEGKTMQEAIGTQGLVQPVETALGGRQVSETYEHGDRALLLHASPIRSGSGRPVGVVLILRDVTQQKRMEQAQRDFISHASHELRTPISSLRGFIELLEGGAKEDSSVRDRFLTTMDFEVDRLQRLIEDLFTLAQLDSGRLELQIVANSATEIVEELVQLIEPIAAAADVRVGADIAVDLPEVLCDRDRITQVLLGFFDNALKHSKAGSTVTVFAKREENAVRLGVSDTGSGIRPEEMPRIFQRFYRVTDAVDKKGAGLGLSIAKEIVEAHGSSIGVESEPGAGATFYFDLKLAR